MSITTGTNEAKKPGFAFNFSVAYRTPLRRIRRSTYLEFYPFYLENKRAPSSRAIRHPTIAKRHSQRSNVVSDHPIGHVHSIHIFGAHIAGVFAHSCLLKIGQVQSSNLDE